MEENNNETNEEVINEAPPIDAIDNEPKVTGNMIDIIKKAVTEGSLIKDLKLNLVMNDVLSLSDILVIGKTGRTSEFHLAVIPSGMEPKTAKLLIGGDLASVDILDYNKIFREGIYAGADLQQLTDDDDAILLRGCYHWMSKGSLLIL